MNCLHLVVAASTSWSAGLVLTVVATFRPLIAIVVGLWAVVFFAVAVVATVALIVNRAQFEVVHDLRDPSPPGSTPRTRHAGLRPTPLR